MSKDEILKQREIGQQLMIIRMVHYAYYESYRTGFSSLRKKKLVEWANKSDEEIEAFLGDIESLYVSSICRAAAIEYTQDLSIEALGYFFKTFKKYGCLYVDYIVEEDGDDDVYASMVKIWAEINAKKLREEGFEVGEELQSRERLEDSLMFFFKFYISRILQVLDNGYDWDVVSAMLGEPRAYTDLLKAYIDKNYLSKEQ